MFQSSRATLNSAADCSVYDAETELQEYQNYQNYQDSQDSGDDDVLPESDEQSAPDLSPAAEAKSSYQDRRATGFLPFEMVSNVHEQVAIDAFKAKTLMRLIEQRRQSGILHIAAEGKKSRTAVLVFRGRGLGCIYGNQSLPNLLFNEDGYVKAVSDLVDYNNALTTCALSEEIVVAASSLFHGAVLQKQSSFGYTAKDNFNGFQGVVALSKMPGCIVFSGADDMPVGMVYMFGGKIVGFYLHASGWQPTYWQSVHNFLDQHADVSVRASILPVTNLDEADSRFTFSLSGLRPAQDELQSQDLALAYQVRKVDLVPKSVVPHDRFIPQHRQVMSSKFKPQIINYAYQVNP